MKQTGPIKRKKDNLYLVDCAVTGSSDGTSKNPKCSLQRIFDYHIFPAVCKLVGEGGKFEGYKPVLMGNGAGPHIEKIFKNSYVQIVRVRDGHGNQRLHKCHI